MTYHAFNAVHLYMEEIGSRLVARTGVPSDRHHLGKLILQGLKDDPKFIMQIDGATGQSETNASAFERSVRCALALTTMGLKTGDVIVLMGPNHINYCVPHNAGLYLGVMVACVDATLGVNELKDVFHRNGPKIIFCQNEKTADIETALHLSQRKAEIVTFDEGMTYTSLAQLLENIDDETIKDFQPADFDPEKTVAYLTSTSGTTGVPKTAMLTHKNLAIAMPYVWMGLSKFPKPTRLALMMSPAQWLSAGAHYLFSPILKYTRLQTSEPCTREHLVQLINKYKPTFAISSPTLMTTLMTASDICDFTCLEFVLLGGSAAPQELIEQVKKLAKTDNVFTVYGMSELGGIATHYGFLSAPGSYGRPIGCVQCRLVDTETKEDVVEPNITGELWLKSPTVFKGYYNDPKVTAETLTEDGWFKSGDIFYRDSAWNLFFVDRYKSLLKYKNHHVAPVEIETVIAKHPGVLHVAVTGIPDKECGDLVVACIVPRPGFSPTAHEVKELVKESLADTKQLRGGVVFMDELPTTSTSKINRQRLKQMVVTMKRE